MKVLVIGLGSMGKRRIRLMKYIDKDITIIGVDSKLERCEDVKREFAIDTVSNLEEALLKNFDCAFLCTSPLSHATLINRCLTQGLHVFTEINLVSDGYDENIKLAKEKGLVLFLSSTFLYRDEIKYIINQVKDSKSMLSYNYHVGQYLPDWHPWENYTDYFIGDARTNGCRELMAIDFPWLYKTFGKFKDVKVLKNKKTGLNISYNDSYLLLIEHENGIQGMVAVDVVSRKAVRNFEVYGEDLYITWTGSEKGLCQYDIEAKEYRAIDLYGDNVIRQKGYAEFINENAYIHEIETFFTAVKEGKNDFYGFEEDKSLLKFIDEIEEMSV